MALVDGIIGHALADEVGADGPATETIFLKDIPAALDIAVIFQGFVHFEMIAPAGEFQAVETPFADFCGEYFQG